MTPWICWFNESWSGLSRPSCVEVRRILGTRPGMVRWDKRGNGPGGRFENDSVDMLVQRVMVVGPVPTILRGEKEDSRDKPENDSGGQARE